MNGGIYKMPSMTNKLGLYTFLETDVVDFANMNENFEKIDELLNCKEYGTATAAYSGGSVGTATWTYRKYTDGSIELYTSIDVSTLRCNSGTTAPYMSSEATLALPFKVTIKDLQMHLSSLVPNIILDQTNAVSSNNLVFKLCNYTKEESNSQKRMFVNVKGVIAIG